MKNGLIVFVCILGLSGCMQHKAPLQVLPELTFQHLAPIALNAAQVEIVDKTPSTLSGNYVDHMLPTSPKEAVKRWTADRLVPSAQNGRARVIIEEASVVEEKLVKKTGLTGMFTTDQSEKYTAKVKVRIELLDDMSNVTAFAGAKASRFVTLAEDYSLHQREKAWLELVEKLMADFDKVIIAQMNKHF
ncbi:hypothetical protein [Candidatus Terasakiella magnetica]|nr:hypothetical protein [Candidatus Terasakiella magnetica]